MLEVKEGLSLETTPWEVVWPYDDAVDLDASDLIEWVKTAGEYGISIRAGQAPTRFVLRPLRDPEIVQAELGMAQLVGEYEACRYGLTKVIDGPKIRLQRVAGLQGLSDDFLQQTLGSFRGDLPWALAQHEWYVSRGIGIGEPDADLSEVSLPRILGAFILARTFRARRRSDP